MFITKCQAMSYFRHIIFATLLCFSPLYGEASNTVIQSAIDSLTTPSCINVKVDFSVTMPQLNDDVVYRVGLMQTPPSGDISLLPYDYIIDWELTGRETPVQGFSAYFNGHHYRYANERLQEYHMEWDSIPFRPASGNLGVQHQAQFANLLPAAIGAELKRMAADSRYKLTAHADTMVNGTRRTVVDAVMTVNGTTAMEGEYVLDARSLMPVRMVLENNPGALSEQTVTVNYSDLTAEQGCAPISEHRLMKMYPEQFEKYRESNFRIENLPGTRMPGFALPTSTGERYSRHASDGFRAPTVIALLDATTGFASDMVQDIRSALAALPYEADVIWAFVNNNIDAIEAVVPSIAPGEHLLTSARSLVRDCGVASLPVLIMARPDGTVADVVLGYNKDMPTVVIQKMALIQP